MTPRTTWKAQSLPYRHLLSQRPWIMLLVLGRLHHGRCPSLVSVVLKALRAHKVLKVSKGFRARQALSARQAQRVPPAQQAILALPGQTE